jgi:multidrug efflux pump subunit AcrB
VNELPTLQNLPPTVTQQPAGDAEIMRDIFTRFGLALATAVLMIFAVLVLLYNSFLYPIAVMAALPLSVGGALMGLLVAQKPLGLFALIGIVLLMGLVTKNSILLVDYALMAREQGKSRREAVVEAGVTRLRPILMTSTSTVAGMMPIALELGAGGETRSPMAIAVIGGFTTSTLLTLVVVPVIYTYIDRLNSMIGNLFRRISGNDSNSQPPTPQEIPPKEYTLSK